mmetsp:Transcript_33562/g.66332  ORF Transcript_33562/g.66332 Transcript_33562/m.66332 type:complete len:226 (-) Transcript_33562:216-893(-)
MTETIALFGATGGTGSEILAAALAKDYKVRVMVRSPSKIPEEIKGNANLTVVEGDFSKLEAVKETVQGADYVISAINGPMGKPKKFPVGELVTFVKELVGILKETPSVKVLLHQSGALVPDGNGGTTMTMKFMRRTIATYIIGIGPNLDENEKITQYLESVKGDVAFKTIVTRPGAGGLAPGDGEKTLVASDKPSTSAQKFKDVAAFTLEAIKDESLYGTYPYVV